MAAYNFKDVWDLPEWFPMANTLNASAAGVCMCGDMRNNEDRHPELFQFASAVILNKQNVKNDGRLFVNTPAMGTFAAGCGAIFVPSAGPTGTLASGTSSTQFTISTALPAAVAANQLANRGDGRGFKIRIIGKTSGIVAEALITANTAGTTPVITVGTALGFTPAAADRYEILSGRVFLMATAASIWKYYDVATNFFSAALTTTNLTAPAVDNCMVVIDELYVPQGKTPGTGFFGTMTATASTNVTNATLTGTGAAADANLQANEYANAFQVRIVGDLTTPASVGQRLQITAHTAASPTVYTLKGTWATAPSNTATYVIEGVGDIICMTGSAVALAHTYAAGGFRADGAWSTGVTNGAVAAMQIPARQANSAAGMTMVWAFGPTALDAQKAARYSTCYFVRGGAVNTIDALDMSVLSWTTGTGGAAIAYQGQGSTTFTTGTMSAYDPAGNSGKFWYISLNGGQDVLRFDCLNRVLEPYTYYRQTQGAAVVGERMCCLAAIDTVNSVTTGMLYFWGSTLSSLSRLALTR